MKLRSDCRSKQKLSFLENAISEKEVGIKYEKTKLRSLPEFGFF